MLLEELAERIASVRLDHPLRVAIDGRSCAGKSTLADGLAPLVEAHGRPVLRASVDGFHLPRAERYRRGRLSAEGYYFDSFDLDALRTSLLDPLGPGSDRGCRTAVFDARTDISVEPPLVVAAPDAVLLFDGVFLFRPELDACWDYRIFVRISHCESFRRGVERDSVWMASPAEARTRYERRYVPGEELYLEAVRPLERADAIVDNEDPRAPRLELTPPRTPPRS